MPGPTTRLPHQVADGGRAGHATLPELPLDRKASDWLYTLRDTAGEAADRLRPQVEHASAVLAELDRIAREAEDAAELTAASDLEPTSHASVPLNAGLIRPSDAFQGTMAVSHDEMAALLYVLDHPDQERPAFADVARPESEHYRARARELSVLMDRLRSAEGRG